MNLDMAVKVLTENPEPDLLKTWDRTARGVPIGRPAEVNLRNNHTQYIFTWWVSILPILLQMLITNLGMLWQQPLQ